MRRRSFGWCFSRPVSGAPMVLMRWSELFTRSTTVGPSTGSVEGSRAEVGEGSAVGGEDGLLEAILTVRRAVLILVVVLMRRGCLGPSFRGLRKCSCVGPVQEALRAVTEAELLPYGSRVDLRSSWGAVAEDVLGVLYAPSGPHDRYRCSVAEAVGCVLLTVQANGAEALLRYPAYRPGGEASSLAVIAVGGKERLSVLLRRRSSSRMVAV